MSIEPTALILDPPKQGVQRGVIDAITERQPNKILHIFCGVDQIPESLKEWQTNGYQVEKIVPLDMFPGTANLEVMVLMGVKTRQRARPWKDAKPWQSARPTKKKRPPKKK